MIFVSELENISLIYSTCWNQPYLNVNVAKNVFATFKVKRYYSYKTYVYNTFNIPQKVWNGK